MSPKDFVSLRIQIWIMDSLEPIKRKIYEVRGRRMMLDSHFAEMFQVETKNLKRAVRANIERFLGDFMFELTKDVYDSLRCIIFTLKHGREQHSKYLPFVFTREGIAMLSGLLRSEIAVQANIMRAFFQMQEALLIVSNTQLQLEQIRAEIKQLRMDKQIREPSPDPIIISLITHIVIAKESERNAIIHSFCKGDIMLGCHLSENQRMNLISKISSFEEIGKDF